MKKNYVALVLGVLLCAAGFGGWIYQIIQGLSVTGLSNAFSWGLYMGSFEFFIGLSSGGMLLFAIAYLWNIESLKPFARLGAVASLASVGAAGVAIMTDLGQPFRVLQMILTPNLMSPLFWDVVVLGLYAVLCIIAVWVQLKPAFKKNKGNRGAVLNCENTSRKIAYIALPSVVILNAVTTLMFAVQNTREWWHSAILPVDSVAVATALGFAFMLLLCTLTTSREDYENAQPGMKIMKKIAGAALLVHFLFTILELVTIAWSGAAQGQHLLSILFGHYGVLYGLEIVLPLVAMIFYLVVKNTNPGVLSIMNLLVIAGVFIHRMMLLLPAFNDIPLTFSVAGLGGSLWTYPIAAGVSRPGKDMFVTYWEYVPTLTEWCITLLPIGIIVLLVALVVQFFPTADQAKGSVKA